MSSTAILGSSAYASEESPYDSGYDHGCDDARISDPDDRYINQDGKGPSNHTDEFMNGYNNGYDSCSGNNNYSGNDNSQAQAQSSNNGNENANEQSSSNSNVNNNNVYVCTQEECTVKK